MRKTKLQRAIVRWKGKLRRANEDGSRAEKHLRDLGVGRKDKDTMGSKGKKGSRRKVSAKQRAVQLKFKRAVKLAKKIGRKAAFKKVFG